MGAVQTLMGRSEAGLVMGIADKNVLRWPTCHGNVAQEEHHDARRTRPVCFVQTLEQSIPEFVKSPGSPTSYSAALLFVWVLANLKGTSVHVWTLHVS